MASLTRACTTCTEGTKVNFKPRNKDLQSIIQACEWALEQESNEAPSAAPSKYIKSKSLINRLLDNAERNGRRFVCITTFTYTFYEHASNHHQQFSTVPEFTSDFNIDNTSSFRQCPNLKAISILIPLVVFDSVRIYQRSESARSNIMYTGSGFVFVDRVADTKIRVHAHVNKSIEFRCSLLLYRIFVRVHVHRVRATFILRTVVVRLKMGLLVLVGKLKNDQSKPCDWLNPILFKLCTARPPQKSRRAKA